MKKTAAHFNLRTRVVAVFLAALMILGFSLLWTRPALADAPNVINPEGIYSCPVGGLFTFEGTGFDHEEGDIEVVLESTGEILGAFSINQDGTIEPNGAYTSDRTTVIIPRSAITAAYTDSLGFYYTDDPDTAVVVLDLELIPNPYRANITGSSSGSVTRITVTSKAGSTGWIPSSNVYVKVDYSEPQYAVFTSNNDGSINATVALAGAGIPLSGWHTITLLSPPTGSYYAASFSQMVLF
ncbi:MAG: hypothetical protein LBU07_07675 [Coriobacteriales bacterium]|jgi:hypothetical protein|nr:hypothetical protein [Coriobacteriales bacterium]